MLLLRFRESLKVCMTLTISYIDFFRVVHSDYFSFFSLIANIFLFLQGEIGIFFPLVVLRSLDGLDCPVNQKISVLR